LQVIARRLTATAPKSINPDLFRFLMLLLFEGSLARILIGADTAYGIALWLLVSVIALIVLHLTGKDRPPIRYRITDFVAAALTVSHLVMGSDDGLSTGLRVAAAVLLFLLLIERIRGVAAANAALARDPAAPKPKLELEYVTAVALNGLFLAVLADLTTWFNRSYSLSLSCMFIALVIIALGFWSRTKPLRLYGLIVTMLCVLKVAIFDVWNADTLMRVIALIGGGLICFAIAALYSFSEKRLGDKGSVPEAVTPQTAAQPVVPVAPATETGSPDEAPAPAEQEPAKA
jgi:hypothetical protein